MRTSSSCPHVLLCFCHLPPNSARYLSLACRWGSYNVKSKSSLPGCTFLVAVQVWIDSLPFVSTTLGTAVRRMVLLPTNLLVPSLCLPARLPDHLCVSHSFSIALLWCNFCRGKSDQSQRALLKRRFSCPQVAVLQLWYCFRSFVFKFLLRILCTICTKTFERM